MTFAELLAYLQDVQKYKPHLMNKPVELAFDLDYTIPLDIAEAHGRGVLMFIARYVES